MPADSDKDSHAPGPISSDHGDALVKLQIGGDRIAVVVARTRSSTPTRLDAGSLERLFAILAHEPATERELESAIAEIEDLLTPVIRALPARRSLVASASEFPELVALKGSRLGEQTDLDVATVEEVFGRLAAMAYGTPASQVGIPEHRRFTATTLVLRELMHHAAFASVQIRS